MTEACIVGWAHSPFGKLDDPDIEALIGRVARAAIDDAGIAPAEVEASFVSLFNNGFSAQDFPASLVLQHVPELRFRPITRYENACASGSAAVHGARDFLAAGRGRFALVIGVEKMTATPGRGGRRHPAEGQLPEGGSRHPRRFRRRVRPHRRTVFPALRRPVRRAGGDRGEEPQERRRQSLCADAQGPGLRVLPHMSARRTRTSRRR